MTISRSGEKRKSAGGIAPRAALGDQACDDQARDDLAFDDRLGFDLDEHQRIDEGSHLDHRCGRPDVLEELTVGAPNVFPVAGNIDYINARAHDTAERGAEMREGALDVLECLHGLSVRVAGPNQRAASGGRGGARDVNHIADFDCTRVPDNGLVFGTGIEVLAGHRWTSRGQDSGGVS